MSKLKVDLQLNAAGYTSGMEEAKKVTKEYTNEVANIRKELPNAQQEYRRVLKDVNNLTLAIRNMTKAERDSAEGRAMTKMLQDAKVRAAELNDMIGDTRQEIKNMASDTRNIDAMGDAFALVGNTMSGVAGAIGLVTGKQEDLNKAIAAFTTVQSITNAMTKVGNILQKQSSLMNVITIAQEKAKTMAVNMETAAKGKNVVVTKAATAAQWAMNAAADANPYLLLASALVAVGVALYAYVKYSDDATAAEERRTKMMEEMQQKTAEYAQTAGQTYGNLRSKYETLRASWNSLKNDHEKNQFLIENKDKFDELTDSVKDVSTAENFLEDMTGDVVRSFALRAKAAAAAAAAVKQYQLAMEMGVKARSASGMIGANITEDTYNKLPDDLKKKIDVEEHTYMNGQRTWSGKISDRLTDEDIAKAQASGVNLYNVRMQKDADKAEKTAQEYIDKMTDFEKQANTLNKPGNKNKPTTVSKPTISKPDKEDKKAIEGTIKWYEQQIDKMSKELEDITALNIDGTININWVNKKNELDKAKNQLKELNEQLESATVEGQKKANEERKKKTEKLEEQYYKSLHAEEEYYKGKEQEKKDDEVKKINDRAEAWSYYGDMVQGVGAAMAKFMDEDSAAMVQWVANSAAMVAQTISQIMAMQASAMAKATDSGASLPFPANIAAIAAGVGAVLSIFASLPTFAEGGVVSGPYSSGDRMLARVNAGERILTAEQNETFNELSKNMGGNTSVAVRLDVSKVRGGDMYLAIKNYMKENNKTW